MSIKASYNTNFEMSAIWTKTVRTFPNLTSENPIASGYKTHFE